MQFCNENEEQTNALRKCPFKQMSTLNKIKGFVNANGN